MRQRVTVPYFILFITVCSASHPRHDLQGKKLQLVTGELPVAVTIVRNSTGHLVEVKGIAYHILEWLAAYYNFQYVIKDVVKSYENSGTNLGHKGYLISKEADMSFGAIAISAERAREVDLAFPWQISGYGLIIPFPEASASMSAPWKTFDVKVWMLLLMSAVVVTLALVFMSRSRQKLEKSESYFKRFYSSSDYILQTFFSQGGVCFPTLLRIRLIAASWCLAAFVVVNVYNTTLISFISSPNLQPVIDTIYDIQKKPELQIVLDKAQYSDLFFSTAQSGAFKYVGDMLNRKPLLRCNEPKYCLQNVKIGSHAYVQLTIISMALINQDLKTRGKCSFTLANNEFLLSQATYALPKGSPLTGLINEGIIKLWETGLLNLWKSWYVANPRQCLDTRHRKPERARLTLQNLSSAFVVLCAGYCLSLVVFLGEVILKYQRTSN